MRGWLEAVVTLLIAAPGLLAAGRLTLLTVGAVLYHGPRGPQIVPVHRTFLIVIPAHDEEKVIVDTLTSVGKELRDGDRVLVVADHCTDRTADIARSMGVEVLERGPETRAGRAEARQAGVEHGLTWEWDAVVFLDADSIVEPGFFDACGAMLAHAPALQARSESAVGGNLLAHATLAAFALDGVTVPRGRDRLGLAARLRGTGMVLARDLAERHRFHGAASEDLIYTIGLVRAGVRIRHVDDARLRSQSTVTVGSGADQRVRWEAGRLAAVKMVPGLISTRTAAGLELAAQLITPPLAVACLLLGVAGTIAWGTGQTALMVACGVGLALLTFDVVMALIVARAPLATWGALLAAPAYVLWKAVIQVRAFRSVLARRSSYPATPRP